MYVAAPAALGTTGCPWAGTFFLRCGLLKISAFVSLFRAHFSAEDGEPRLVYHNFSIAIAFVFERFLFRIERFAFVALIGHCRVFA